MLSNRDTAGRAVFVAAYGRLFEKSSYSWPMISAKTQRRDGVEDLWNKTRTARYLGIAVKTLDAWLRAGRGPRGRKVGVQVRFLPDDVRRYLDTCRTVGGGEVQRRRAG